MDAWADVVFGQPDFTHKLANNGGLNAASLAGPQGVALDAAGNLYVADTGNNRVLEYNAPLAAGANRVADRVFGQPDFTHNTANNGGISASSLDGPFGVTVDGAGRLWIADTSNNRVLEFDAPLTSDRVADAVIGQANFTHNLPNRGGLIGPSGFDTPLGLALDAAGNLYVAEFSNQRVLEFNTPLSSGGTADRVFGQSDFTHNTPHAPTANSLAYPFGVALDAHGNLYVADNDNARVLEYDTPLVSGATADRVFGQPTFSSNSPNSTGLNASSLSGPVGLALNAQGDLFVADSSNNRVLQYTTPLTAGVTADRVFGQPSFTVNTLNTNGLSAASLDQPYGVAVAAAGDLLVADTGNQRALAYRSFAHGVFLPLARR
jgi:hypothetical protein